MTESQASFLKTTLLAVAIVAAAGIVHDGMSPGVKDSYYPTKTELSWSEPFRSLPVEVTSKSNDVDYNTYVTVAEGAKLVVRLQNGEKREVTGTKIKAKFYHLGGLLVVDYVDSEGKLQLLNYFRPLSWGTVD